MNKRTKIQRTYLIIWGTLALAAIIFIVAGTTLAGQAELTAENGACGPLSQEAEAGTLNGAMAIGTNSSGVTYVHAPADTPNHTSDAPHPNNFVSYCVTIAQSGNYSIEAAAHGDDNGKDSFWVVLDGKNHLWDTGVNTNFAPDLIKDRKNKRRTVAVDLTAGQHTITFHQRERGAQLDRFTFVANSLVEQPQPTAGPGEDEGAMVCGSLRQEAEFATLFGQMIIGESQDASGGKYIYVPDSAGQAEQTPDPDNRAEFCITILQEGEYIISTGVHAIDHGRDSFHVTVDGLPNAGYLWQPIKADNFVEDVVSDRGKNDEQRIYLQAGNHTLTFHRREPSTLLDWVELIPTFANGGEVDPIPPTATSVPATATVAPTAVPPTATPISVACDSLSVEAESGTLQGHFTIGNSSDASGGSYIYVPNQFGHAPNGKIDLNNRADFCVNVPEAGEYKLVTRVLAADSAHDSFFVTVDGAPSAGYLFDIREKRGFANDELNDRGKSDPAILTLSKGKHIVSFYRRESGTMLDKFELVLVSSNGGEVDPPATVTPTPIATSVPPTVVPTVAPTDVPPTSVPDGNGCDSLIIEAETATLFGHFEIGNHADASGGGYISVPSRFGHAPNGKIDLNNRAEFCVDIQDGGTYKILTRVLARDAGHDSFFVTVDGAPAAGLLFDTRENRNFISDYVNDRGKSDPAVLTLAPGRHTITFYRREADTFLDKIELVQISSDDGVTPNPTAEPTQAATAQPPTTTPTSVPTNVPTSVPPTPTPHTVACDSAVVEAEDGTLQGHFAIVNDSNASGNAYITIPTQFGHAPNGKIDLDNRADFCIEVDESGEYRILGRVLAPSSSNDSFFVTIDGAPSAGFLWSTKISRNFVDDYVNDRGKADPATFYLSAGKHIVSFYRREAGTKLDKFEVVLVGSGGGSVPTATAQPPNPTATSMPPTQVPPTNTPAPTAVPPTPTPGSGGSGGNASGSLLNPLDIRFNNPSWGGNPFDLVAKVTFTHSSGSQRSGEMFYNGGNEWVIRFTADRTGTWTYSTQSSDSDLNGKSGTVSISGSSAKGFVVADGDKWTRSGNGQAFVPQYLMAAELDRFYDNPGKLNSDLDNFMGGHGFTGFHIRGYCHWFDLGNDRCRNISSADRDPDIRTFEVVEQIILETYARGGTTHIWMYGDNSRTHNPTAWGLNGTIDQRMQRYLAARLGAVPGWTMGYGYDISEWAPQHQIETWYTYLNDHTMYPHLLSARGNKNTIMQHTEILSYSAYEQHNPDYGWYVDAINDRPNKPSFSEDRFRIAQAFAVKDYTYEETRRGMWHSAMVGGIANIWGNMQFRDGGSYQLGSRSYPNKSELKIYANFMNPRFRGDMEMCNSLTNGMCLKSGNSRYIFYRENTSSISLNLSGMSSSKPFVAINTKTGQQVTGTFQPGQRTWNAPTQSDWAIAVGNW